MVKSEERKKVFSCVVNKMFFGATVWPCKYYFARWWCCCWRASRRSTASRERLGMNVYERNWKNEMLRYHTINVIIGSVQKKKCGLLTTRLVWVRELVTGWPLCLKDDEADTLFLKIVFSRYLWSDFVFLKHFNLKIELKKVFLQFFSNAIWNVLNIFASV